MAGVAVVSGADWWQEEAEVLGGDCYFKREECRPCDLSVRETDLMDGYWLCSSGRELAVRRLLVRDRRGCGGGDATEKISGECWKVR
jgi:hypothetical protein